MAYKTVARGLKPCPFCGGKTITITSAKAFAELVAENGRAMIALECAHCGATLPMFYGKDWDDMNYSRMARKVRILWNQRPE